ncbi:copper ion binding [Euphorbia peplus]|nr:copper ion binding [Euphorbia peplus]
MVGGGGNRKDESVVLNSTNVFAALDTLRKKKKSDKSKQASSKPNSKHLEAQKEVFWAPAPLTVKSWADVDDDDDDDYYATTAPPVSAWAATPDNEAPAEVSESEEEGLDEVDDDIEEEHENDDKLEASLAVEPIIKKPSEASSSNKEPERQLSKKELKKKGLEELDAVLAELGYAKQDTGGQDDSHGAVKEEKQENSLDVEKKENVPGESKSSKKKKKKEKMSKEDKEPEDQPQGADLGQGTSEAAETEKADDASTIDVKARLKKVASSKKKKSSKEIDASARAAAVEAAARRAKLAAAKKKEKTHYNQQPVR